jgi:hypothetical protein
MAALGVSLGPRTPETLIEEVGRLLMQKVHSTPNTQQAEQSWLHTRREQKTCQSIFPEN